MVNQPVWHTELGELGTFNENELFSLSVEAIDPDTGTDNDITYVLVSGSLPRGVLLQSNGTITGIPIPEETATFVTYKFVIRATLDNRINDRTFSLVISGQSSPVFITEEGVIGTYFNGDSISYQIEYEDQDANDTLSILLINGELPPNLYISDTGLISGNITTNTEQIIECATTDQHGGYFPSGSYENTLTSCGSYYPPDTSYNCTPLYGGTFGITTNVPVNGAFDHSTYDSLPFDNTNVPVNGAFDHSTYDSLPFDQTNIFTPPVQQIKEPDIYTFTLQLSDRKEYISRTFSIIVNEKDNNSDPYIINYDSDLGSVKHDNYYALHLEGINPVTNTGESLQYFISSGNLPNGLDLNSASGWITGNLSALETSYINNVFGITVKSTLNNTTSNEYEYNLQVTGNAAEGISWVTPTDLGIIDNGEISTVSIVASNNTDKELFYRIVSGSTGKLPQGLQMFPSGNIVGRVSFDIFSFDSGDTTFGIEFLDIITTFDSVFDILVEAYTLDGTISLFKLFTLTVNKNTKHPHNDLLAKALPPYEDRTKINDLLSNEDIFNSSIIYRADDFNFGVAKNVTYQHAFGLSAIEVDEYVNAMNKNHYNKTITLGPIKTARALDDKNNLLYEVIYSEIIDDLINPEGISIPQEIDFYANSLNTNTGGNQGEEELLLYPNSLENMRKTIVDNVGHTSRLLPRWMLSEQPDGTIIGFVPAWVIAYVKPGKSQILKYNLSKYADYQINDLNFELDRLTLRRHSKDLWNTDLQQWNDGSMIVFDLPDSIRVPDITGSVILDGGQYSEGTGTTIADCGDEFGTDDTWTSNIIFDGGEYLALTDNVFKTETIFDGGNTVFRSRVDTVDLLLADEERNDIHLAFPNTKIVDDSTYIYI